MLEVQDYRLIQLVQEMGEYFDRLPQPLNLGLTILLQRKSQSVQVQ